MMTKIDDLEIWDLLRNPNGEKGNLERLDAAWVAFVTEVQNYCRREQKLKERARKLWLIRSRIAVLQYPHQAGAGEKCADPRA